MRSIRKRLVVFLTLVQGVVALLLLIILSASSPPQAAVLTDLHTTKIFGRSPESTLQAEDTANPTTRSFDNAKLEDLRSDKAFDYSLRRGSGPTLWQRLQKWISDLFMRLLGNPNSGPIVRFVLYALILVAMVFTVMRLLNVDPFRMFRRTDTAAIPYSVGDENIHDIEFEGEIQNAVANKQYTLAIRLYYLFALKILSDSQKISWTPSKTNQDYYYELGQLPVRVSFANLSRVFEFSWYGGFEAGKPQLEDVMVYFSTIKGSQVKDGPK